MSGLVGNPEDRFSRVTAQVIEKLSRQPFRYKTNSTLTQTQIKLLFCLSEQALHTFVIGLSVIYPLR